MSELGFVMQRRRHLHQCPELSLHEFKTIQYITRLLDKLNVPYEQPFETGAAAYLEGNSGHTIAFRVDIDALSVLEENSVDYCSQTDNVMHTCGHDGHTTTLMLFVKRCEVMADQYQLPRNVVFIFQPVEEIGEGANCLIKAGAFNQYSVKTVFGIHVNPFAREGQVMIRDEEVTASVIEYRFLLRGLSSYVAGKEQGYSCGEVLIHVLNQVGRVQQYHLNGLKHNIAHMNRFNVGEAINTVPSNGHLKGTVRTYGATDLNIMKNQMNKTAESVKLLFNVDYEVKSEEEYLATMNNPKLRHAVRRSILSANLEVIEKPLPFLSGEDPSFYSQQLVPSCFAFVGTRDKDKGFITGLHTSYSDLDKKVLTDITNYYEQILSHHGKE